MALYKTPRLTPARRAKLTAIAEARAALGVRAVESDQWVTAMRRTSQAAAYASSTAIEGFTTDERRASELLNDAAPVSDDDRAFVAYARAMQHVGVFAAEKDFAWSSRAILDLHFDACSFQRRAKPGALREGPIYVTGPGGTTAYTGPPAEQVPGLLDELVDELKSEDGDVLVSAAMAHLNLVSIHPFEDGNGRLARILQSALIARSGETAPELGSIEEHLAANTSAYYEALASAQAGEWSPGRSAEGWLDFCLDAHLEQAKRRSRVLAESAERWQRLENEVDRRGWPDRLVIALERALAGSLTRGGYAREAGIAMPTASSDLRRLVDAGLIDVAGGGRSTEYVPAIPLRRMS